MKMYDPISCMMVDVPSKTRDSAIEYKGYFLITTQQGVFVKSQKGQVIGKYPTDTEAREAIEVLKTARATDKGTADAKTIGSRQLILTAVTPKGETKEYDVWVDYKEGLSPQEALKSYQGSGLPGGGKWKRKSVRWGKLNKF